MKVAVGLLDTDRSFLPLQAEGSSITLEFVEGQVSLRGLGNRLGMPPDLPRLVFVRGEPITDDHEFFDGDEVVFVTLLGGG